MYLKLLPVVIQVQNIEIHSKFLNCMKHFVSKWAIYCIQAVWRAVVKPVSLRLWPTSSQVCAGECRQRQAGPHSTHQGTQEEQWRNHRRGFDSRKPARAGGQFNTNCLLKISIRFLLLVCFAEFVPTLLVWVANLD